MLIIFIIYSKLYTGWSQHWCYFILRTCARKYGICLANSIHHLISYSDVTSDDAVFINGWPKIVASKLRGAKVECCTEFDSSAKRSVLPPAPGAVSTPFPVSFP